MGSIVLYLIRHSIPEYRRDGSGIWRIYGPEARLTPEGVEKAWALAAKILQREGAPLDIVLTSPFFRTRQTASILAEGMGVGQVIEDDRFRDVDSLWPGVPKDEFFQIFEQGKLFNDPRTLETLEQLARRMLPAISQYVRDPRYEGKRLAVVSHGDPLRALYFRLRYPSEPFPAYSDLVQLISFDTAAALRLVLPSSSWQEEWIC